MVSSEKLKQQSTYDDLSCGNLSDKTGDKHDSTESKGPVYIQINALGVNQNTP